MTDKAAGTDPPTTPPCAICGETDHPTGHHGTGKTPAKGDQGSTEK